MKDTEMTIDWRTVQFFLDDEHGICEVFIDAENHNNIKCTCPSFTKDAKCFHLKVVKLKLKLDNGHFKIQIPESIDDSIIFAAMSGGNETFREFLIKYGKIEVIE